MVPVVLLPVVIATAQVSAVAFYAVGGLLLAVLGICAWRWPLAMLVVLVLAPILDRYVVSLAVPSSLQSATTYFSEALLAVTGTAVALRAARDGRLLAATRHPVVAVLLLFVAVGLVSAVANGVPPIIAAAGILFTVEASAVFVLARTIRIARRPAIRAVSAFVSLVVLAATLALAQVLVHPNFMGLESFVGRFGEGHRVASFLVSPNMLGALLAMALPFLVLAAVQLSGRPRAVAAVLALVMALALLYTFSRGAWLALLLGVVVTGLVVDRRAIAVLAMLGVVTFAVALVLPRHVFYAERSSQPFDLLAATFGRLEALGGSDLRVQFVENAAPIIADHPIVGAGPGRYGGAVARSWGSPLYSEYTAGTVPRSQTVDNFWLHLVVEFGVVGAALFATAIGMAVREGLLRARASIGRQRVLLAACATVGLVLAVDALTEMVLEGNTTTFTMWFTLGLATSLAASPAERGGPETAQ